MDLVHGAVPMTAESQRSASAELDRAVVADLHDRRGGELFGFARHLGLGDEEAHDAAQEALLRLWVALDSGTRIEQPDAWTFRTLYRICMDEHRWRRRVRGLLERLGPAPEAHHVDPVDLIAAWDAVERLPERQRLAIYLRYRSDLPFEEIGAILGIAAVSARSHVSRALDTLRASLAKEMD
jgi:RNA polymerase sigma-70 factor (ECF subfamily)